MEIKNLKKAAKRILKAVKKGEKIIVYGDADLDGVSSVIITEEAIRNAGKKPDLVHFPDRETEGHGLTLDSLKFLKDYAPALLIVLDCGIASFKEIVKANKLGLEVIVIDHHEILDKLPQASIIVDPKQKGDKYPFKQFCAAGLAFKLSEELLGDKMTGSLRKDFLELAAIATIADKMPQREDNELIIEEGLSTIESSWRPGLQALLNLKEYKNLELKNRVNKINSLLNVRDIEERMPAAYRILTSSDEREARDFASRLYEKGLERKEKISEMIDEVERKIYGKKELLVFEGSSEWPVLLLGVAASIIVKRIEKPIFLYQKKGKEARAGIRAPSEYNVVEAMKACSSYLRAFGGHPQAAGFSADIKKLPDIKECLTEYFENNE